MDDQRHIDTDSRTLKRDRRSVVPARISVYWTGKSGRIKTFSGVQTNNWYWSATTNAGNTNNAWIVNLNNGNVSWNNKTNSNYVWPVRGGE